MKISFLLFAGAALCSSFLRAGVLYTNFDTPDYDFLGGSGLTIGDGVAVPFTVPDTAPKGFSYALSEIQIAAFTSADPAADDPITVALYNDAGGLPGTELASLQVVLGDDPGGLASADFSDSPLLSGDEQYWVVLSDPEENATWNSNLTGASGAATYGQLDEPPFFPYGWTYSIGDPQGAVEVDADLVSSAPEPGTLLMFAAGLSAIVMAGRRRVRQ